MSTGTTFSNWNPFNSPVQGYVEPGGHPSSDTVLALAGPPFIDGVSSIDLAAAQGDVGFSVPGTDNIFYPIGSVQRFIKSENKGSIRIPEIGSAIIQLIPTKASGAFSMDKINLAKTSMLRALYAIYGSRSPAVQFPPLLRSFDPAQTDLPLKFNPGHNDQFFSLFSDLFNFPFGLLIFITTQKRQVLAGVYLENAFVESHTMSTDANSNLLIESVRGVYSRSIPARVVGSQQLAA